MTETTISIRFPSKEAAMAFCKWMCAGGGEQEMFACMKIHCPEHAVNRMQYHREDERFKRGDKRRYGKFMAENLIVAQRVEE